MCRFKYLTITLSTIDLDERYINVLMKFYYLFVSIIIGMRFVENHYIVIISYRKVNIVNKIC